MTTAEYTGPFNAFESEAWPHQFRATMTIGVICGGVPSDANKADGWIRSKVAASDDVLRDLVAQTMVERGITVEEATEEVAKNRHLNGFKRGPDGVLYIEGRQVKAAIKEAANSAVAAGLLTSRGWGTTNKGLTGFIAEHVMVVEDRIPLGVTEPTNVIQKFVHTFRGSGIQYEEVVEGATIEFTVRANWKFSERDWAMIWLTGQEQGLGASRSQGYGRYQITGWEPVAKAANRRQRAA